jgi:hypothetical protein
MNVLNQTSYHGCRALVHQVEETGPFVLNTADILQERMGNMPYLNVLNQASCHGCRTLVHQVEEAGPFSRHDQQHLVRQVVDGPKVGRPIGMTQAPT